MKLDDLQAEVARHYRVLAGMGRLGPLETDGYLRAAYSAEESEAMRYIEQEAKFLGARSRSDALGNLSLEWGDVSSDVLEFGSHVDTVPQGGNFDGLAGIVASLVAIGSIDPEKRRRLRLRIWRGEESSTFNCAYLGSLSAFGQLPAKVLSHSFRGVKLEDAMRSQGANPELVREGLSSVSQSEIDSIKAHIELHIEQGKVLEVQAKDIGIVTSIRGPKRLRIVLRGAFDHSGATPMGVQYRQDVNLALATMLVRLDALAQMHIDQGSDLVQTCGVINSERDFNEQHPEVYVNAVPKVSGFGYFCLDIRSCDSDFRTRYAREVEGVIASVAAAFPVQAEISVLGESPGVPMLPSHLQEILTRAASDLNISHMSLASGAGHDAAIVGQQRQSSGQNVPVAMIFIPCRNGRSHCPEEFASFTAIAKGAQVLARVIGLMQG